MPTASTFSAPALPKDFPCPEAFLKGLNSYRQAWRPVMQSPGMVQLLQAFWLLPDAEIDEYFEAQDEFSTETFECFFDDLHLIGDECRPVLIELLKGSLAARMQAAARFVRWNRQRCGFVGADFTPVFPNQKEEA